jgi:hypothetical protein
METTNPVPFTLPLIRLNNVATLAFLTVAFVPLLARVTRITKNQPVHRLPPSPPRTSGRWGDAGQGSSQAAPPQFDDDGSDDDGDNGGDYTVFYRHLGM